MPIEHLSSIVPSNARRLPPSAVWASVVLTVTMALIGIVYWVMQAWPKPVAEAADSRLQCMSYAPYRHPGESPLNDAESVPQARLHEDLSILVPRTACVRTYSATRGLEGVPAAARQLDMQVNLGVWLSRDRAENEVEIESAIRLANEYPDVVKAVIVGNEVLLRRELPPHELARQLERVRAAVRQPVTYADVWEVWEQHPELAAHVAFVTIHILPYWEDHPVSIGAAINHVVDIARHMRDQFGGKPVLIGETGWPSAGRSRRDAVPGRVNQTQFFREFTQAAKLNGLQYNFIEAFDQPWKRGLEGAMGGAWGLFDSDGHGRFPPFGPVREDPQFTRGFVSMLLCGLLALALTWLGQRRGSATAVPGAISARVSATAFGVACGAAAASQVSYLWIWNRYPYEWIVTLAFSVLAVFLCVLSVPLAVGRIASRTPRAREAHLRQPMAVSSRVTWRSGQTAVPVASGSAGNPAGTSDPGGTSDGEALIETIDVPPLRSLRALATVRRTVSGSDATLVPSTARRWISWLSMLRLLWLIAAAGVVLLHLFDARYRGFPIPLFALPLAAFAWLTVCGYRFGRIGRQEWVLAIVAVAGGLWRITMEGLLNVESIYFYTLVVCLVGLCVGGHFSRPPK